jgi:hypothetical protein
VDSAAIFEDMTEIIQAIRAVSAGSVVAGQVLIAEIVVVGVGVGLGLGVLYLLEGTNWRRVPFVNERKCQANGNTKVVPLDFFIPDHSHSGVGPIQRHKVFDV